jgi:anti-sigma factor ChrR (cupin superfamily)
MNETHITPSELQAFRDGALPPDQVMAVGRHLAHCADCAGRAAGAARDEAIARDLAQQLLDGHDLHLDAGSELFPYVDGGVDDIVRERIETHLAVCRTCRDDVDDLRRAAPPAAPRRRVLPYALAVAAALAVVLFATLTRSRVRTEAPRVVAQEQPRDPREQRWRALVDDALQNGIAAPAVLRDLAPRRGTLRGASAREVRLAPRNTVIEETRPAFRWSPVAGATYRVFVFEDGREVASSPALHEASWRPHEELARGRTYAWQLEIAAGDRREIAPGPAAGPATIRIADAATAAELQAARARHADDPLLLGILYARAGLADAAGQQLEVAALKDARAVKLRDEVRAWR